MKWLVALLFFIVIPSLAMEPQGRVFSYLSELQTIRVYISPAPGFGHQAASLTVIKRLRQIGFQGAFELVYADEIAEKLEILLPGFDKQNKEKQTVLDNKSSAIALSVFKQLSNTEKLQLGLTGADDGRGDIAAKELNVETYLRLQPLEWGPSFYYNNDQKLLMPQLTQLPYFYEIESDAEAVAQASDSLDLAAQKFQGKKNGIKSLLNIQNTNLGMIYGVGLVPNMSLKIRFWAESALIAQRGQHTKLNQGVVLALMSGLNAGEILSLQQDLETAGAGKMKLVDVTDPQLADDLQNLNAGEVLIVNVGQVPQNIFELLFKLSSIPALVAGKNAANLAQILGLPYLNTVQDYKFLTAGKASREVISVVKGAGVSLTFSLAHISAKRQVARFINQSLSSDSIVSRFYQSLKPKKDKVAEAIQFVLDRQLNCSEVLNASH